MPAAAAILVIDDEPNLRQSLTLILQRAGYLVTTAGHAQEARQHLRTGTYDLTFLDLKMPGTDGLALLPEIRRLQPDMPVLILTAHATLESAMEAVRQGARDYLLKPVEPKTILDHVRDILAEQQPPKRRREIAAQLQELVSELHQIETDQEATAAPATAGPAAAGRFMRHGSLTLDLYTRRVELNDQQILLPPSTFDYLVTLLRHSPNPVPFTTLVKEAQGYDLTRAEARDIARGQIHELRKALEPDLPHPRYIITIRDVGYSLVL